VSFCNVGFGAAGDCVGTPENLVRYDSPTFYGFSFSADWGQDTYWDTYVRYSGEYNGIKLAAVTGWSETNGCHGNQTVSQGSLPPGGISGFNGTTCLNSPFTGTGGGLNPFNQPGDVGYWQSGLYIEHVATGVWFLANYGREFLSDMPQAGNGVIPAGLNLALNSEPDQYYFKGGLRERWHPLGHTVLYGFYGKRNDMISATDVFTEAVTGAETKQWGLGVVQEVDAAAMSFWLQWDEMHASVSCIDNFCHDPAAVNGIMDLKNINLIKGGALINF